MTRSPQQNSTIPLGARVSFRHVDLPGLSTGTVAYINERPEGYGTATYLIEFDKVIPGVTHTNTHGMPGPSFDTARGWWIDPRFLTVIEDQSVKDMATYYDAVTEGAP